MNDHKLDAETVEQFRLRARAWLADNMTQVDPAYPTQPRLDDEQGWLRARELQQKLYRGGFAGICFPRKYGGLGLSAEFQRAFNAEARGYELPTMLNTPSLSVCAATLLDCGSEDQKTKHLAAVLRGDEVLCQLLSEPSGGSDLAAVRTRAIRRDDHWILSGAKTWSTAAFAADYGLCLARTNWDVPKHQGLTMFLLKVHQPGITVRRITQLNGSTEFCEEFFDDVELGDDAVVGEVNKGWDVASRQLYHERRAMGDGSEFASGAAPISDMSGVDLVSLARQLGKLGDPRVRELLGRARVGRTVHKQLIEHVTDQISAGALPPAAGSLIRLSMATTVNLDTDIALEIAETSAVVAESAGPGALPAGIRYLSRQDVCLGGGSTEMARNIISERILNMPKEFAADKGIPFNQVAKGPPG